MRIRVTQNGNVFWVVPSVTAGKSGCFVAQGVGMGNLICFGSEENARRHARRPGACRQLCDQTRGGAAV